MHPRFWTVKAIMDRFDARRLYTIAVALEWTTITFTMNGQTPMGKMGQAVAEKFNQDVIPHLKAVGLALSVKHATRIVDALGSTPTMLGRELGSMLFELAQRIGDELDEMAFVRVDPKHLDHFEPSLPPFGAAVATAFPSATYDIAEAAKCLALGRSTASAFHSMRVVEIAVRALARCLSIPDPLKNADRNWGVVLRSVRLELDRRWPTAAAKMEPEYQVLDGLYASLDAMKNPWRNPTMHVEATYTEEEAEDIFRVVGAFMRTVAARCDEQGLPGA